MVTIARIQHIPSYVSELRSKTGLYIGYIPNAYADQVSADNFYETLRKDPEIARCLHLLSLMSAGEKVVVQAENEDHKKLAEFALNNIHDFLKRSYFKLRPKMLRNFSMSKIPPKVPFLFF